MNSSTARMPAGPAGEPATRARPWYLLVLGMAGIAGLVLLHRATGDWRQASASGDLAPEVRQGMLFALLLNAGLGAALALASLGESLAAGRRALRQRAVRGAGLARPALALMLLVGFVAAHALWNPWTLEAARVARRSLG